MTYNLKATWGQSSNQVKQDVGGSSVGYKIQKGRVQVDATLCPQDIAYPTYLNLLSAD
jgi:hypothetical protein